jgi:excisionase family DNA binding protein
MAHYTVAQVGEIWGFSAKHIRKLIKDGKLKAIKFGGEYRVTQEQVDEFERINTTGGNQTITTEDDSSNNE